ncbi:MULTISPECIES: ABC transporter substrate-binding protein [unclassified Streptomyces]|uniref:ABC transporter substrate-binding protein n=1 Tax=unclassified Streptomyces TaxID=2593676 RepID=UPI003D7548D5
MSATIAFALDAMPLTRDLHLPVDYSARFIAEGVLAPLFASGSAVNSAVEASPREGGARWQVRLDEGLRWSDGAPLRAVDAVRGIAHALKRGSNAATTFLDHSGKAAPVVAIDERTVEYRFRRPITFAPELMSIPDFAPRRRTEGKGLSGGVALGPFAVERWQDREIVLRRNPHWEQVDPCPDELRFTCIAEPEEAVRSYLSGAIDMTATTGFGVKQAAEFAEHPHGVRRPIAVHGSLDFGRRAQGFLHAPQARRALAGLIDRAALSSATQALTRPWLPSTGVWESVSPADRDALRRAAKDGLDIAYSAFAPNAEAVTELASQLGASLGVAVTTTELTFAQYVRASADRDFCLLYALTSPVFDHPAGSLSFWRSTGRAARQSAFADERFDELLDLAEVCEDPTEAAQRWRAAEERWWWTVPKIPLVQVCAWFLCSPGLAGARISVDGLLRFERLLDGSTGSGRLHPCAGA